MSVSGTSESVPLELLLSLLLLPLLLLESSPGRAGAGVVGKGCSVAADEGVVAPGESGGGVAGVAGFAGAPGNGNCSAVDGFFAGGGHGVDG
jgi:hypothetical protein